MTCVMKSLPLSLSMNLNYKTTNSTMDRGCDLHLPMSDQPGFPPQLMVKGEGSHQKEVTKLC